MVSHQKKKKKKSRSRRYSAETMTDTNYTYNLVLLANTLTPEESLQHRQEPINIRLYVNENKTEYICFKQKETVFTRSGKPLKLV